MSTVYDRLWSDEDRRQVAGMLTKGATALAVANQMNLTRNAVIGRITRDLDLKQLWTRIKTKDPKVDRRKAAATIARIPRDERIPVEPAPENSIPLWQTGTTRCKWPVARSPETVGGILCCGGAVEPFDVYCLCHRLLSCGSRDQ